jgi:hypothetical protein
MLISLLLELLRFLRDYLQTQSTKNDTTITIVVVVKK